MLCVSTVENLESHVRKPGNENWKARKAGDRKYFVHVQTVSTRLFLRGEGPGDEAGNKVDTVQRPTWQ